MKIIQKDPYFWKFETTASYILLMVQYLYILVFGKNIDPKIAEEYVNLWYYDFSLFFPIILLVFFPHKARVILLSGVFIFGLVYFFTGLGFNSIVFNTFICIFLANRFLLFNICESQKNNIFIFLFLKILIIIPAILITFFAEFILEYFGITLQELKGDGQLMATYGIFLFFGSYYGGLAYISYREAKRSKIMQ